MTEQNLILKKILNDGIIIEENNTTDYYFTVINDNSALYDTTQDIVISNPIQAYLNNDIASGNLFGSDIDSKYVKYNLIGNKQEPEMLGDAGFGTFTINNRHV